MNRNTFKSLVLGCLLSSATMLAVADDTDIYINPKRPISDQPLVMFSIDWRPNLTSTICDDVNAVSCVEATYFRNQGLASELPAEGTMTLLDLLRLSLHVVLRDIKGVKVGLMLNHEANSGCAGPDKTKCSNGGYIARGFRSLDEAGSLSEFLAILKAIPLHKTVGNNKGHSYQGKELFFEFFRYLTGQRAYNNANGWNDYATDDTLNLGLLNQADTGDNIAIGRDDRILVQGQDGGRRFVSPLATATGCAKIFTVNFLDQVTNQEDDSDAAIQAARSSGGMGFTLSGSNQFAQLLGFLRDTDLAPDTNKFNSDLAGLAGIQNVTSYFVAKKIVNTTIAYAKAGGTENPLELTGNASKMVETLQNIFQQILSVSTTFVAASVPVNVFNRAEIVDNVYFALFQAEAKARWKGNLKKLKLGTKDVLNEAGTVVGKQFNIVDALNQEAIGGGDGRILSNALTYWTDNSGARLAVGDSNGDGIVDAKDTNNDGVADNVDSLTGQVSFPTPSTGNAANPKDYVTGRDGRHIPRGGAGQKIPGFRSPDDVVGGTPGDSNPTTGSPAGSDAPPPAGPRKIFYLNSTSSSASLQALNVTSTPSNELKIQLGSSVVANVPTMTDLEAQKLMRYARGQDAGDENLNCADTDVDPASACRTEARYWMLGDPLHSRPLPINYGAGGGVAASLGHQSKKNPAIFIAMASNDGHLRMFRNTGGTTADTDVPAELGQEVWSFIPPEGLAVQKRLLDNSQPEGESPHPYSFDGEATALIIDQNGNGIIEPNADESLSDRVILYIGLRRGGSAYYALDVTDPLTPKFLWRITPTSRTTTAGEAATTDFAELGQTFSRPRIARLNLGAIETSQGVFETRTRLAVMFGGGYDGGYALGSDGKTIRLAKDIDGRMADDTKGKAIFAVRANNASLIWKAVGGTGTNTPTTFFHSGLRDSIPSNLTLVDSDADGAHDRVYVGDTAGTLWRVDMVNKDSGGAANPNQGQITDDWRLTRLACIGRHSSTFAGGGCSTGVGRIHDRRFFHEPDVVQSSDVDGRFDAVVIGSGDREDPLDKGGVVENWFYVIKDRNVGIGGATDRLRNHFDLTDVTNLCLNNTACTINAEGWRLQLDNPTGEKALSAPVTIANSIFFTTYLPPGAATNTCGPGEGGGFLYALKLATGAPARNYNTADGGPNPDGSGTTDSDRQKDLETPGIPAQVVYLGVPPGGAAGAGCTVNILAGARILEAPGCPRFRTFWQREAQ